MNTGPDIETAPGGGEPGDPVPVADIAKHLLPMREMLIGNIVLHGEIPSPTFQEQRRNREFLHRLIESGVQNCAMDEAGNGIGMIAGTEGQNSILLAAGADTVVGASMDHSISVQPDRITGAGLSDSLGISVLASIPDILNRLGIRLRDNLILLAGARGAGRGNLEGIRYFLKNNKWPLQYGICLKGKPLGRLSYTSIGMLRGQITCKVPPEYDWTRFGASGAVLTMNQVITSIASIPLPSKPNTSIVLGSIEGGNTFDRIARRVDLKFEIRSEDADMVDKISGDIVDIVAETEAQSGVEVRLDIFARRQPGGIQISHPLVRTCRNVMTELNIKPRIMPSTSETSALIDAGIPAVTLGISQGHTLSDDREEVEIAPMLQGIAQIVGVLRSLNGGASS